MSDVDVPEDFRQIGYSGLFHTTCSFPDDTTREKYTAKAPYLVGNTGWMLLTVRGDGLGVLVRRDANALWDLLTMKPPPVTEEGT
jgi:hypothetical protein